MWSVSSGERFFVRAMDSSEAMVLMGLMEKAEKHGVLDEYYRQVKSGKQQDEDMFSWVSSEDRFDVPKITPKEYWCQIFENHDTRIAIPEDCDRSFELWAKTRLELPKYQELNVNNVYAWPLVVIPGWLATWSGLSQRLGTRRVKPRHMT